jgi:hypothetical protein
MMQTLASLLVGHPLGILCVGLVLFVTHRLLRHQQAGQTRRWPPLLIAAIAWGLYAAWELLVNVVSPEANIRVDLLLIWPALALLTFWAIVRSVWPKS